MEQPTDIRTSSLPTLKKYGLSLEEWLVIHQHQGGVCAVCKRVPISHKKDPVTKKRVAMPGIFHIDHVHVPGWKKMLPDDRKKHVRGLLCQWCNRSYMSKGMTLEKAQNMVIYLNESQGEK